MQAIAQLKKSLLEHNSPFIIFLLVGSLTAIAYLSLFILFSKVFHGSYQLAVSISYAISVILHFFANRKFTFKRQSNLSKQLPRYSILLMVNYFITLFFMHVAIEVLHVPPFLSLVLTIGATSMLTYLISKFWVFQAV